MRELGQEKSEPGKRGEKMEQRTQEERARIVARCVEIEKAGGDVLGYLSSEHYISPAATWHNMQKFDLKRTEFSDGKPSTRDVMAQIQRAKPVGERTDAPKKKRHPFRVNNKPKKQTEQETKKMAGTMKYQNEELAELVVRKINDGFTPVKAIAECGYKNPHEKLETLKKWALDAGDNDLYAILSGGKADGEPEREAETAPAGESGLDAFGNAPARIHEDDLARKAVAEEIEKGSVEISMQKTEVTPEAAERAAEAAREQFKKAVKAAVTPEAAERASEAAREWFEKAVKAAAEEGHTVRLGDAETAEKERAERKPLRVTALEGEMAEYRKMADGRILISSEAIHHDGWLMTPEEMEKAALEFFEALRMMGD